MKLRTKFLLFMAFLHLVTLVLSFMIFRENKLLFIASEALIIISLWLSWGLYKELIQPLKTLMTGVEAIQDRDFNIKFLPTGKYEMDQLIGVYNNMIDQLREERTRQQQQHFFLEKLIATAPTGIIILDYDYRIEQVNPKAEELLHLEEKMLKGRVVAEIQHPLLQHFANLTSGEARTISINGMNTYKLQLSHFVDRGFPRHFITIEELTAEILAAEKNVYGKVIRMMAHEVTNTVGPVNSILQSALKTDVFENERNSTLQNALQVAINRNSNLNQFMRNFADLVKLPQPVRNKVNVHQLVHNVCDLMSIKAEEKEVSFIFELDEQPFFIAADEQQLEQALINIVKNALEAMETKGSITFQTDAASSLLRIADTGKGITESEAEHLFAPFFSTKKDGQGIGLTLVRDILRNHGFEFSLKTIAPHQTVFTIKFA
ncbi:ATP-binding protein [Chitinophagaceae bacterium LB-8]|uniref:histidine kinase n=1 Tax=Paraflavisolibacter caeni TaxID=2982496 RepID=A0A9X2XUY3_9BACT|nr:ATP-binding protein [Paraflavisolibacter caeni]MCU7549375.1 ATP-binding protein [Paraflavisolibacter caeni]